MTDGGDASEGAFEAKTTRRAVLGLAGAGLVGAVGLGELSARPELRLDASVPDDEWHVPGRTPARTGAVPDAEPRGEPTAVWRRSIPERGPTILPLPPLVADDTVVVGHHRGVSVFTAASGERRWTREIPDTGSRDGQVTVVGETVVVIGRERAWGLALDSGRTRWVVDHRSSGGRTCRVGNAVALVTDGLADEVSLLNAATGKPHWRGGGRPTPAPLCVLDGRLFGVADSRVMAVDPADGTRLFDAEVPISSALSFPYSVSAADGRVYLGMQPEVDGQPRGGPRVVAVDRDGGEVAWTAEFGGADHEVGSPPTAVAGGTLYATNWQSDRVIALDAATGERRWAAELYDASGAVVVGDRLLALGEGQVVALDVDTGRRTAVHDLGAPGFGELAYSDGRLYVRREGTLTALSW
jgi:outer membrane protein assembly factor BamB